MIPHILHQIWVGPNPIPRREVALCNHLKEVHKDYSHLLWTNDEVELLWKTFPPEFQSEYQRIYNDKKYAWCADLLRLWVVYTFGGIYLDIDFEVLQHLPEIWEQRDGVFFYHKDERDCINGEMSNSLIGGTPGLYQLAYCLNRVGEKNNNWWYGPSWFGTMIKESMGMTNVYMNKDLLRNLEYRNIVGVCFEDFHGVFLKHHGLYSWSDDYIVEKVNA